MFRREIIQFQIPENCVINLEAFQEANVGKEQIRKTEKEEILNEN